MERCQGLYLRGERQSVGGVEMVDGTVAMTEIGRGSDSCLNVPTSTLHCLDDVKSIGEIRCYGG